MVDIADHATKEEEKAWDRFDRERKEREERAQQAAAGNAPRECCECGEDLPEARQLHGYEVCVDCAETIEHRDRMKRGPSRIAY